jgi:hypothetical protein
VQRSPGKEDFANKPKRLDQRIEQKPLNSIFEKTQQLSHGIAVVIANKLGTGRRI